MRKLTAVALSICTFGIAWAMSLTIAAVQAQDNLQTSIVGVWKLSSFTRKDLQSGEVTNVFGERPVGYLIYTKAGRIFAFLVGSDRKAPNNAEPTDSERAELFKSMVGYTGTYKSKAARSSLEQMRLGFNRGQELIGRRWRKWSVTTSRLVCAPRFIHQWGESRWH